MPREPYATIDRLLAALRVKTQAQLAAGLQIRPQSIVSAVNRKEIPEAWLYRVAYLTGRNVEWLRTGRGPVWREPVASEEGPPAYGMMKSAPASLRRLLEVWDELDEQEQATVVRLVEALRLGDREIRDHLIREMKLIEESLRARRTKRTSRRRPSGR